MFLNNRILKRTQWKEKKERKRSHAAWRSATWCQAAAQWEGLQRKRKAAQSIQESLPGAEPVIPKSRLTEKLPVCRPVGDCTKGGNSREEKHCISLKG